MDRRSVLTGMAAVGAGAVPALAAFAQRAAAAPFPQSFLRTNWLQPSANAREHAELGINLALGKVNSETEAQWDAGWAKAGVARCRQHGPDLRADAADDGLVAFTVLDEPDLYDKPPAGYTLRPDGGADIRPELARIRAVSNKPIYVNLMTVSVINLWPRSLSYIQEKDIGFIGSDFYPVNSGQNFLMSRPSGSNGFPPPYGYGLDRTTTHCGRAILAIRNWNGVKENACNKPVLQWLQTADFASNGKVPTPGQHRCLAMSTLINGGAGWCYFTQHGLYGGLPFSHDGTSGKMKAEIRKLHGWVDALDARGLIFDAGRPDWRKPFELFPSAEADGDPNVAGIPAYLPPRPGQIQGGFEAAVLGSGNARVIVIQNLHDAPAKLTHAPWGISERAFGPYQTVALDMARGTDLFA